MAVTVEPAVFGTGIKTIRGVICCPAGQVSSCTRPTRRDRTQARAHCGCKSQRSISTAGPCARQDPYSNDIFHALDLGYPEPGREAVLIVGQPQMAHDVRAFEGRKSTRMKSITKV